MRYFIIITNFLLVNSIETIHAQNYRKMLTEAKYENRIIVHFTNYKVETYVYNGDKNVHPDDDKYYSWFAAHDIKNTRGGYDGKLLHGEYAAFYHNKNLKEKGWYKYGLKTGEWKKWYFNGEYQEVINWRKGKTNGRYALYDSSGNKVETGRYKKNKRHGIIRFFDNDGVSKKKYKRGYEKERKSILSVFHKNKKDSQKKRKIKFRIPLLKKEKDAKDDPKNSKNSKSPILDKNKSKDKSKRPKDKTKIKVRRSIKVVPIPNDQT